MLHYKLDHAEYHVKDLVSNTIVHTMTSTKPCPLCKIALVPARGIFFGSKRKNVLEELLSRPHHLMAKEYLDIQEPLITLPTFNVCYS